MRTRIGLTGGIGSGKSTVAEMMADLGAVIIDADALAREVVEPGTPGFASVVARFGPEVVAPDGSLDRGALGRVIFGDEQARADLNSIVHPLVRQLSAARAAQTNPDAVVVMVIPLLVETSQMLDFDAVVVVDVPEHVQRARVRERDGLTTAEVEARMKAQASRSERLAAATHVIANDGSLDHTRQQVAQLWADLHLDHSAKRSRNQASS